MKAIFLSPKIFGLSTFTYPNIYCLLNYTGPDPVLIIPTGDFIFKIRCNTLTSIKQFIEIEFKDTQELPKVYKIKDINKAYPEITNKRQNLKFAKFVVFMTVGSTYVYGFVEGQVGRCFKSELDSFWQLDTFSTVVNINLSNKQDIENLVNVLFSKNSPYNINTKTQFFLSSFSSK